MLSILCFTWKFCQKYGNSQGKAWGNFEKHILLAFQKLILASHLMYWAAKLPKALCLALLCTVPRYHQGNHCNSGPRISSFTMKGRSTWNSGQPLKQSLPSSLDILPRRMPAFPIMSYWHSSKKPGTQRWTSSKQKRHRMTMGYLSQPNRNCARHHRHLWRPSMFVTRQLNAWSLAKGQPDFAGAQPFGSSDLPHEAWHCHKVHVSPQGRKVRQQTIFGSEKTLLLHCCHQQPGDEGHEDHQGQMRGWKPPGWFPVPLWTKLPLCQDHGQTVAVWFLEKQAMFFFQATMASHDLKPYWLPMISSHIGFPWPHAMGWWIYILSWMYSPCSSDNL